MFSWNKSRLEPRTEQVKKKVYTNATQNGWDQVLEHYVNNTLRVYREASPIVQVLGYYLDVRNQTSNPYELIENNYEVNKLPDESVIVLSFSNVVYNIELFCKLI